VPVVAFDANAPASLRDLLNWLRPHVVINAIGYGVDATERDEEAAERLNTRFVAELAQALLDAEVALPAWSGPRLLHLGSAFEYGSVAGPLNEETECHPLSVYGRTKLEGTRLIEGLYASAGLRAATARVATVYGPGEHPHRLLPTLAALATTGDSLPLTGGAQERDFTFVADVAEGLARLAVSDTPPPPIVNLATGQLLSVRGFVECVRKTIGLPSDRVIFGAVPYREDEVWQGPIVVDCLEGILNWRPGTSLAEGIRRTLDPDPGMK
jgi:nucleoside-diphosphate-sugar epimerase